MSSVVSVPVRSVSTQTDMTAPDLSLIFSLKGAAAAEASAGRKRWWSHRSRRGATGSQPASPEEQQARSSGGAAAAAAAEELHPDVWPPLPHKYFWTLAEKYGRQSYRPRSYKYEVKALDCDAEEMSAWARHRFGLFLEERCLHDWWTYARHGQLPWPVEQGTTFEKYDFSGSQLELDPLDAEVVYHGTYPECFCRTSYFGLQDSSQRNGLGHDCRTTFDALFTAESMEHAMHYAWPANFLQDNLYYGLLFELVIDKRRVFQRRRGEVLVPAKFARIRALYLLTNLWIRESGHKCAEWDPSLEFLPVCLKRRQGQLLMPYAARESPWHN